MSNDLLPIGRFARLCRLSVKQLRHYDDLGLLAPAWIDPASGYRYYRPDQARDALSIGLLRALDVPLPVVARVLSGDAAQALKEARDRIEDDLDRRRRGLRLLDRVLAEGLPEARVTIVREPARRVRVAREAATPSTIPGATSACVRRVLAGGVPQGALIGLFPLDMTDEFDVRVALEAPDGDDLLPGGPFAVATHTGPYDQIPLTVYGVLAWIGDHGHAPGGPVREVYLDDPAATDPGRLRTQVMIRLEDA
ncbi:GyrI-like domain-containing protein [Actinomadura graeca]|uniref:GyrI-like domain-containing protein n=1 Tax=Actinomadura graeca TaxID=2750812 RepID=A0ABX8QWU8_9ACTN|nr:MerR family transcriptional regulator [Actinomadura graeca]QXJ23188.1 GyrI-like domain-containing protein [Actinomadura graeca]